MPDNHSIAYTSQRFQYKEVRHPKTGIRLPAEVLEFIADEHEPVKQRMKARERHLLETVHIEMQGELLQCKCHRPLDRPQMGSGRGRITMFSRKARKNMLDTVSRIDWTSTRAQFITLTYHSNMLDASKAKRDLRAFLKRIYRREGKLPTLWKLEPQKRGAWHFHLIIWEMSYWSTNDILKHWRKVTGEETITQVKIEPIQSAKKARSYCAKYLGKPIGMVCFALWLAHLSGCPASLLFALALDYLPNLAATSFPGRFWGIENRINVRYAQLKQVSIAIGEAFYHFKRAARRKWGGINKGARSGYTLYVHDNEQWFEYLFYLVGNECT